MYSTCDAVRTLNLLSGTVNVDLTNMASFTYLQKVKIKLMKIKHCHSESESRIKIDISSTTFQRNFETIGVRC